ncbi:MAG: DUF5667 domain-containing protein [Patescibacteria group bacterium]|jgi:hypothetical protein
MSSLIKNISRIKNLESVQPDRRWEKTTKFDLLDEISSQNRLMQAYKLSTSQKVDLFVMRFFNRVAPSMSKVLATFLVFMMFFGVNMAAQASVPGETLWPVKRSIEEAEISLTFSPVKKTEVHIKHVNERLDEIDKILEPAVNVEPAVKEQKNKAIKQAITHLEKDVTSVDSSLKIVKSEKEALEVVELVKKVTDATKEVDNKLSEKKLTAKNIDNQALDEALTQAKVLNKQVKKAAVAVAIEVHEELQKTTEDKAASLVVKTTSTPSEISEISKVGPFETSTTDIVDKGASKELSSEEVATINNIVKEILVSEIADLSAEVKDVKQKVEIVNSEALKAITKDALGEKDKTKIISSELDEIEIIKKESSEDSEVVLTEAKVLLDSGMFKDAFEKVSEANEKYQKAEVTLEKIGQAIKVNEASDAAAKALENQKPPVVELPISTTTTSTIEKTPDIEIIKSSAIDIKDTEIIKESEEVTK